MQKFSRSGIVGQKWQNVFLDVRILVEKKDLNVIERSTLVNIDVELDTNVYIS